ncbi:hypothetical protein BD311DRAFT_217118 [Dichomitus squalens]|uniref:Uncharacterized protein n=1 Tax=Dichomitus squalens TaxID=114155 RepID=A0A4V2K0X1_9APHY|nr:hypothetical protein BD311DRAFT_217118 [Dichomitus squalens]
MQTSSQPYIVRPDSRARQEYLPQTGPQIAPGGPQAYGWNPTLYDQPGYNAYPAAPAAYPAGPENQYPGSQSPYGDPNAYTARPQSTYGQLLPQGYPGQGPTPYGLPPTEQQGTPYGLSPAEQQGYPPPGSQHQPPPAGPGPHFGQGPQAGPGLQPQPGLGPQPGIGPQPGGGPQLGPQGEPIQGYAQPAAAPDYHAQGIPHSVAQPQSQPQQAYPQPGVQIEPQPQPQAQQQPLPQAQPQVEPEPQPEAYTQQPQSPQAAQQQPVQQQPAQQQSSPAPQQQSGPPYVYDPNTTYADPNVQAWAQYYAHGGTDPTGSVYFISVPGVKEGPPPASRTQSVDSATSPDGTPVGQAAQTAPLSIHKGQPAGEQSQPQPQPTTYGASPYAPAASLPAAAQEPSATGQPYYGLENQFAGMGISGNGPQNGQAPGPQGVGAPA